ncbi:Cu,Zn superoxide dismutase-like protein, partial [Rozella allomycis CSF55]
SNSTGYVEFIASKNNTQIEVNVDIIGMKPNTNYSFAITTYGELRGKGLKNVGMHFNPNNKTHGCLPSNERHAGDLGIGLSDEKGFLNLNFTADSVVLNSISYNGILGRAAVIYEG